MEQLNNEEWSHILTRARSLGYSIEIHTERGVCTLKNDALRDAVGFAGTDYLLDEDGARQLLKDLTHIVNHI